MSDTKANDNSKASNDQQKKKRNNNRNRNRKKGGGNNDHNNGGKNKKTPPPLQVEEAVIEEEDAPDHHLCMICYSSNLHLERGITPCGHDSVCSSCHLRLRSLHNDKKCPVCKATNEQIIIDADDDPAVDEHKTFEQYEKWGDDIGPNFTYRDDVAMFFPNAYHEQMVVPLFRLSCNYKRCNFGKGKDDNVTLKDLQTHLATAHNPALSICDLCVEFKRDFISRLPRFTPNQLRDHNKYGDNRRKGQSSESSANKGHPMCQFCQPTRFYDLTKLHEHLHREHYECHVCKKFLNKPLQFFKNYSKLNQHFDREHYLCHHPDCLAARFVVFANEIDLRAHERDVHGLVSSSGSTKIQMEFRVRSSARDGSGIANSVPQQVPNMEDDFGFGLDGEVFVPDALEDDNNQNNDGVVQVNEPEITHGPHAERTALLREQARVRREALGLNNSNSQHGDDILRNEEEAFPTLGGNRGGNMINWSREGSTVATIRGRNTTQLNQENFPSLGGGPSSSSGNASRKKAVSSKLRATRSVSGRAAGGATSSFSAISNAANVCIPAPPMTSSRPFANAATTRRGIGADQLGSTDAFPSLGGGTTSSASTSSNSFSTTMSGRKNSKPNLNSNNFPSLGAPSAPVTSMGGGSNKYASAQAFAKKNAVKSGMNLNTDAHFPSMSSTVIPQKTKKKHSALDKKPAARGMSNSDNFLSFPPPPITSSSMKSAADAKAQVEGMKMALGPTKYKQLKKFTKEFASETLNPESYVSSALSLFDDGIKDPTFWEYIPNLISTIPNESRTKRALRYLESLRYSSAPSASAPSSLKKAVPNGGTGSKGGWGAGAASGSATFMAAPTSSLIGTRPSSTASTSRGFGYAATVSSSAGKGVTTTGFSGRSLSAAKTKTKNSWAGGTKSSNVAASNPTSVLAAAASQQPSSGTASKFMAKEKKAEQKAKHTQSSSSSKQNGKKKKAAKAKKNELRNLAFGA